MMAASCSRLTSAMRTENQEQMKIGLVCDLFSKLAHANPLGKLIAPYHHANEVSMIQAQFMRNFASLTTNVQIDIRPLSWQPMPDVDDPLRLLIILHLMKPM